MIIRNFKNKQKNKKINIDKLNSDNIVINKGHNYKLEYSSKLREIREQYEINTLEHVILLTFLYFYH